MKKKCSWLLAVLLLPVILPAQLNIFGYAEYGYSIWNYKSDELNVFFDAYNNYQQGNGLTKPFDGKMGLAKGSYFKFGVGIGSTAQMILDFGIMKSKSKPMEARFSDGSGRDIQVEHRNSNTTIGVRFGGTGDIPLWVQLNTDICIQTTTIHSFYVFPDGSRSLGLEHSLNGSYSDFTLAGGLGMAVGCRLFGPVNVSVQADYIFNFGRGTPEYHQYEDLQGFKDVNTFLPRDMAMYVSQPYNATENSISNDMRGLRFTAGIQVKLGKQAD